ncbi:MAG: hypothetical protein ACI9FR_002156 [Cryomorphaceae bacterium]|jgi:hypothetical protein
MPLLDNPTVGLKLLKHVVIYPPYQPRALNIGTHTSIQC